ncbi:LCP family protein [Lachnoclostridium sp.]|uniref:LCP family protein n=1 Tax=Lachnoclostridium sp. TaxID=2028282 RepID=UPI00289727C9|nr:LCP family protein [Lachnoclostridium sp.]
MNNKKTSYDPIENIWDEQSEDKMQKQQPVSFNKRSKLKKKKKTNKVLKRCLAAFIIVGSLFLLIFGTRFGRGLLYHMASSYVYGALDHDDEATEAMNQNNNVIVGRQEDGVLNILLYGIEEIGGAKNTDSMMIASINSNQKTVKLVSLMRDTYVSIPGWKSTKLNAAYAKGGVELLVKTIEENYKIHIDAYASVNFESFEQIVDSIGGVTIELGKEEAKYLRRTNYISNPEYRTVKAGVNTLNGNQLLGYCRVRKVKTLGGANNDYGRTVRHRRAMNAIFDKVKSQNIFKTARQANKWMGDVTTNITKDQIETIISTVIENRINTIDTLRIPVDGMFNDPKSYQGVTYPLVLDWDKNIEELYRFLYE